MKVQYIILSLLIALLSSCATTSQTRIKTFTGSTHSGKKITVTPSKNGHTALIFLSVSCPCSNSHIPIIKKLALDHKDVEFVAIHSNYNEKKKRALKYFQKLNLPFAVIHDSDSKIAKEVGALKTPHVFILNSNGETIYNGSVTNSSLAKHAKIQHLQIALEDIAAGRPPTIPKRKTLGCYIPLKE